MSTRLLLSSLFTLLAAFATACSAPAATVTPTFPLSVSATPLPPPTAAPTITPYPPRVPATPKPSPTIPGTTPVAIDATQLLSETLPAFWRASPPAALLYSPDERTLFLTDPDATRQIALSEPLCPQASTANRYYHP